MENTNIAVVTVPLSEWMELKNQINGISKNLLELNGKSKPEFLTPKQCQELLKISRNTFQSYIDKGIITAIKMKSEKYSKILVKRADIDYIIENRN